MELVQREKAITPFDVPPANTKLIGTIVIGRHDSGAMALEFRLPSGVPLNHNDPAHQFGIFVTQNAQQLLSIALQEFRKARAIEQTNEIIVASTIPGA